MQGRDLLDERAVAVLRAPLAGPGAVRRSAACLSSRDAGAEPTEGGPSKTVAGARPHDLDQLLLGVLVREHDHGHVDPPRAEELEKAQGGKRPRRRAGRR